MEMAATCGEKLTYCQWRVKYTNEKGKQITRYFDTKSAFEKFTKKLQSKKLSYNYAKVEV